MRSSCGDYRSDSARQLGARTARKERAAATDARQLACSEMARIGCGARVRRENRAVQATPFPPSFSRPFPISFKTLVCCQARSARNTVVRTSMGQASSAGLTWGGYMTLQLGREKLKHGRLLGAGDGLAFGRVNSNLSTKPLPIPSRPGRSRGIPQNGRGSERLTPGAGIGHQSILSAERPPAHRHVYHGWRRFTDPSPRFKDIEGGRPANMLGDRANRLSWTLHVTYRRGLAYPPRPGDQHSRGPHPT